MKKILAVTMASICLVFNFASFAFAGTLSQDNNPIEIFEITGGIDKEKDAESTFDKTRTISGSAESGTEIIISVYTYDEDNEKVLLEDYDFIVGASEIFSQSVNLAIGENYILIEAYKDEDISSYEVNIKRKEGQIKQELEQGIALPGKA